MISGEKENGMRKNSNIKLIKIMTAIVAAVVVTAVSTRDVKAFDPNRVFKMDATVSDAALMTFGTTYDTYIPAGIKMAFESENGRICVIPHNVVDSRVNLSGWAGGSLSNVTGYLDPNGGAPVIYCNSKVVDNASRYREKVAEKVVIHEVGHFVNLEVNKIRYGSYSYTHTDAMKAAFQAEINNYQNVPNMLSSLYDSFRRNTDMNEYYANIFAGLILDPVNTQAAFPMSCQAVSADVALVNSKYAPALESQQQAAIIAAQQAQAAQALALQQQQAAQAAAIQQAQMAQAQAIALMQAQQAQALALQQAQQAAALAAMGGR